MPRRYKRSYRKGYGKKKGMLMGHPGNYRKNWFGKGFKWGLGAVWKTLGYLKGAINVEHKYVDTDIANSTNITGIGPGNGLKVLLNGVAQGDGGSQRNGNSIRVKHIGMSFDVKFTTGGNATQLFRWALMREPETEGTVIDPARTWTTPGALDTQKNPLYPREVQFLAQGNGRVDVYHPVRHVSYNMPVDFREVFIDTTNLIDSISRSSLYLFIWSDVAANYPAMSNFVCRVRYIDN